MVYLLKICGNVKLCELESISSDVEMVSYTDTHAYMCTNIKLKN